MPKKLEFEKSFQNATVKIYGNRYCVVTFFDTKFNELGQGIKCVKYYQVRKNRKKIKNYSSLDHALRRMMLEANQEINLLFNVLNL